MALSLQQKLMQGCAECGLALDDRQQRTLLAYLNSLVKWNQAYNLTAIRDPDEMLVKHLLDSLGIHPFVTGARLLDVGTGPGLPGIPLSLCRPDSQWTLLDSNGKKTRFLLQMKQELSLDNVQVVKARLEELPATPPFDAITCRAFSSLPDFVGHGLRLLAPAGYLLAMKGQLPHDELAALDRDRLEISIEKIHVPFLDEERHLIKIRRKHTGSQAS